MSQLWGGVSWGWLVEGAVVEGWGRGGGVLFFGAEFAWVKAGRVGGGHVWGVGGMRWGVMVGGSMDQSLL